METYLNLEKLSNDLKNLFQNQNQNQNQYESYFDFEIICEQNQTSFKTHKSILSSRSQYFKSLFNSKMKEYQENKLILKDVSNSILFSILNYFYSGKIEINLENVIEILIFSSKYLIDELIEISLNFIKNNLQFETIVDILKLSERMNLNQLLDSSYQFIFENFEEFIKTPFFLELEENHLNSILSNDFILINEFELFQSIIKWEKHKSNINQIPNIIDKIRFIDFSKQEIEDTLKQELIPNQISQKLIQFQNIKNEKELNQFIEKEKEKSLIFKSRKRFKSKIIKEKEYFNKLKEWINDNEFFSKMKLGYSAKIDGFDYKKWHEKCDDKGKTLVIIKTKDNFIFGGFTQIGWISSKNDHSFDENAFLFSLKNPRNDPPQKFPINLKSEAKKYAVFYGPEMGPFFGNWDLCFIDRNLENGHSWNFGYSYILPKGIYYSTNESKNYLAGRDGQWKSEEIECFFV
ncbi:kelch-like protein [Anaeramoeba ignava]|uniref:Kelch-like protein n=1 Tax=Anaeramoeba ignava TaxID=1746090 RepID=A0A9Q0LDI0_ANAIG|nr:kelch-like protein [Anaeramoeba ignava]